MNERQREERVGGREGRIDPKLVMYQSIRGWALT